MLLNPNKIEYVKLTSHEESSGERVIRFHYGIHGRVLTEDLKHPDMDASSKGIDVIRLKSIECFRKRWDKASMNQACFDSLDVFTDILFGI